MIGRCGSRDPNFAVGRWTEFKSTQHIVSERAHVLECCVIVGFAMSVCFEPAAHLQTGRRTSNMWVQTAQFTLNLFCSNYNFSKLYTRFNVNDDIDSLFTCYIACLYSKPVRLIYNKTVMYIGAQSTRWIWRNVPCCLSAAVSPELHCKLFT